MKAFSLAVSVAAALLGAACGRHDDGKAPVAVPAPTEAPPPLVGVHYFGNAWPKNFIAGFRRADVPADFARIAADGFNSVILLVPWGEFQPVGEPCCWYEERAWERLHFLLDQAQRAELKVVLRVGYAWAYHPQAGDSIDRAHALMNRPEAQAAYAHFVRRLGNEVADQPQVVLSFMSWEDQWLHRIDDSARAQYQEFLDSRPDRPAAGTPFATPDGDQAERFNAYWDWLVIEKLYKPAIAFLPTLSYEARVDKEPNFVVAADGTRRVDRWLGHPGMQRLPPSQTLTIYWAPFWGARNQGEQLAADESLALFDALLDEVRGNAGDAPIFIDQFNVVDNTPGYEANAKLRPDQIPAFLERAVCLMRANGVRGYGWWAGRDYVDNPLYNPAFGYGLDGWTWLGEGESREALESMPMGDFRLRLRAGEGVSQTITRRRGQAMAPNTSPDQVCVTADAAMPSTLLAQAGDGAPTSLLFPMVGVKTHCAAISSVPVDDRLELRLQVRSGELALQDVQVFKHVQDGGLYHHDGQEGPLIEAVRRMNADFRARPLPSRCVAVTVD